MDKWADFCISAVRYDADETHIERVKVHEDLGDKIGGGKDTEREIVVANIDNGKTYVTIRKKEGKWNKGEDVHIVTVKGKKYIRTDKNAVTKDNLENLPTY
jgi:hypothetical protein